MRRVAVVIAGGVVGAAGCFAPFSWPDERRAERGATPEPATSAVALVSAAPEADHLALAADRLERGDDTGALPHLSAHVEAHPDAVMIRAYLAELLVRTGKPDEARCQF
jgi:thioredoxin-like negative regulator of GroEL